MYKQDSADYVVLITQKIYDDDFWKGRGYVRVYCHMFPFLA